MNNESNILMYDLLDLLYNSIFMIVNSIFLRMMKSSSEIHVNIAYVQKFYDYCHLL